MLSFLELVTALGLLCLIGALLVLCWSDVDLTLKLMEKFGQAPESLAGQVVWITGASSGIGEFTAYRLAKAGCRLVLSAPDREGLERVKAACLRAAKGKLSEDGVLVLVLDSVQFASHKDAVQQVLGYFNRIDILVNNAGRAQRAVWMDVELAVDRELFEVNVAGPVSLTQAVLPHMIERRKGHIVVISSIAGKIGVPLSRSYSGSKFALHGFFECLRLEMEPHNIDITLICPGPVFSNILINAATAKHGEVLGRPMNISEKRMATDRCADAIAVSIANKLYESWISQNPWLLLSYFCQHFPDTGKWLFIKFGSRHLMKMREGYQ